jgi:hypothetical protein
MPTLLKDIIRDAILESTKYIKMEEDDDRYVFHIEDEDLDVLVNDALIEVNNRLIGS